MESENTSDAATIVKGTSGPRVCAIPTKLIEKYPSFETIMKLTHGNSGFPCRRWPCEEHGASSDSALLYHLQDHTSSFTRLSLTDHSLRVLSWFKSVVETQPTNV